MLMFDAHIYIWHKSMRPPAYSALVYVHMCSDDILCRAVMAVTRLWEQWAVSLSLLLHPSAELSDRATHKDKQCNMSHAKRLRAQRADYLVDDPILHRLLSVKVLISIEVKLDLHAQPLMRQCYAVHWRRPRHSTTSSHQCWMMWLHDYKSKQAQNWHTLQQLLQATSS